ncbi:hypothetical protein [Roseiconus lacunae]|uniref:Uncharacterized protein n=1 Tax=Roseiconus lacunae TaxID=2605694 RepID=A0ABT7PPF3_9BACT|nr:hypothetical protein [Roseiconus lacunae]MCD0458603.1 hypothetical protein [Roseiconus lacunae]MDM4018218.1 hypothetical protein [Roseiconus lacunae]
MERVLVSELFDLYPDGDLVVYSEPMLNETIPEYLRRTGYDPAYFEDGVLRFMLSELAELNRDEAIGYLDDTVCDLLDARDRLANPHVQKLGPNVLSNTKR